MNKTAKEMFEELEYKCLGGDKNGGYIAIKYFKEENHCEYDIEFTCNKQIIICKNHIRNKRMILDVTEVDMNLLKAINKQVKELGWLDE